MPPNLAELESFNLLGVFNNQPKEDSPTEVKMKSTSIFINQNPSFDNYFAEMRKRNLHKSFVSNQTGSFTMTPLKSGAAAANSNTINSGGKNDLIERRKSYAATGNSINSRTSPRKVEA